MKKELNDFLEKAKSQHLHVMGLTGSSNGYPEPDMGYFVHGFETLEEAQNFKKMAGGELIMAEWKAGWGYAHYVDRTQTTLPEPCAEFYGDDYIIITSPIDVDDLPGHLGYKNEDELRKNESSEFIAEKLEKFNNLIKELNAYVAFEKGEVALISNEWEFEQTLKANPMQFSNDNYQLAVGVAYLFDD